MAITDLAKQTKSTISGTTAPSGEVVIRDLDVITSEIRFYKRQAGEAIIEIGNRLIEAKEQLDHGAWLDWLGEQVDFSEATAQRFMRLAREYSDSVTVTDLGVSKALALLTLPPEEREVFLEEAHDVGGEEKTAAEMSRKELETAVRERAEALRQKAEAETAAEELRQVIAKNETEVGEANAAADSAIADLERIRGEKERLESELEQLRNAPPVLPEEPGQQMLEDLRKEAAKEAKAAAEEKLKKKIEAADAAKRDADQKAAAAAAELEQVKGTAEREQAAAAERITALEKKLAVAFSETITIFKTQFENAQGQINAMLDCLNKLKEDPETRNKLTDALRALCEKTIQGLPVKEEE